MYTAVVFTVDSKLASQLDIWCRNQLDGHLRVESYRTLAAYKEMLQNAHLTPKSPDDQADKEKNQIRLFIIDAEVIMAQKVDEWIAELQQITQEMGSKMIGVKPSVLAMGYETGPMRADVLQQVEAIDDFVLKPVDKSVFLQKVEFLTAEAGKVNPSFLFRARTERVIEAGRDVVIEEISEFAVAVRSPISIPDGAFASIHSDVFGSKGARRLIGRVYESIEHPVRDGEFLVRFSYFGVSVDQLSTVRRYIKQNQTQVRPKSWGASSGGSAPTLATVGKPAMSKQLQEKMLAFNGKKLAVIDLNPDSLAELKGMLESSFKGVTVQAFPSYARFAGDLQKLLKSDTAAKATQPLAMAMAPGVSVLPGGNRIAVILRGKSRDLVAFEPQLRPIDMVMGRPAGEWLGRPDLFMSAIEKDDREAVDEFLSFLEAGSRAQAVMRMRIGTDRLAYFSVSGSIEKGGADGSALLHVNIQQIESEQWSNAILKTGVGAAGLAAFRFDSILIDGAFLRPDPLTWHQQFMDLLKATKVLGPTDKAPKIFVLADPKAQVRLDQFRYKEIADFTYRPIDRRFMVQKYVAFMPGLIQAREPDAPPFIACEITATLGKDVTMDELAEYGLSIVHPTTFKDKSFMRFFSDLFGDDGAWVTGKCHSCVKKTEAEIYRCQFMFFGPNEELLRRIRSWIREDYVTKKEPKS